VLEHTLWTTLREFSDAQLAVVTFALEQMKGVSSVLSATHRELLAAADFEYKRRQLDWKTFQEPIP
jgi:hypothetical protein